MFRDPTGKDTIRFQTYHRKIPQPKNGLDRPMQVVPDIHSRSISVTHAPGEDVFYYENTFVDENGHSTFTRREIDYNGRGLTETEGLFGFLSKRDTGEETVAKYAPKELINYLVKKDYMKYKSLDIKQKDIRFYGGFKSVSEFAISWYVGGVLMNSVGKLGALNVRSAHGISIREKGIVKIEQHLARMDADVANTTMINRLKKISAGEMEATIIDKNFYIHELREMELMAKGMSYERAHIQALGEYGIQYEKGFVNKLYTEEALKLGDEAFRLGN